VRVLSANVFYEVSARKLKLPPEVEEIRSSAFGFCLLLKGVTLWNSIRVLGGFEFAALVELVVADSVELIENNGFAECMCLRRIVVGPNSSLTKIKAGAFEGSSVSIGGVLPSRLQKVEANASGDCLALRSVSWNNDFRHSALDPCVFRAHYARAWLGFSEQSLAGARWRCSIMTDNCRNLSE
jgi:hypothetical protein